MQMFVYLNALLPLNSFEAVDQPQQWVPQCLRRLIVNVKTVV